MTPRQAKRALEALDRLIEKGQIYATNAATAWELEALARLRWHLIHLADSGD